MGQRTSPGSEGENGGEKECWWCEESRGEEDFGWREEVSGVVQEGDHVTWETSQGETQGTAKRMVREPMDVSGHHEAASEENPEVLVRSYKSGKKAVHKPAALRRR